MDDILPLTNVQIWYPFGLRRHVSKLVFLDFLRVYNIFIAVPFCDLDGTSAPCGGTPWLQAPIRDDLLTCWGAFGSSFWSSLMHF